MTFVEKFLQQNLTKDLNQHGLAQIQQQNSAVQNLVSHIQNIRSNQNLKCIKDRINRIQTFLQLKIQILTTLQPINSNKTRIFDWVLNIFANNKFLYELLKRQQFYIQQKLIQIGKKALLQNNYLQQHHQETQLGNKIICQLNILDQQKSLTSKTITRQKIKQICSIIDIFQQKIRRLVCKVFHFNSQMISFIKKLIFFEQKIISEFHLYLQPKLSQIESPQSNQQNQIFREHLNPLESQLFMISPNEKARSNSKNHILADEMKKAPKKYISTQELLPIQMSHLDQKQFIPNKKLSSIYPSNYNNSMKRSFYQSKFFTIQNKKSSVDFKSSSQYSRNPNQGELLKTDKNLKASYYYQPYDSRTPYQRKDLNGQFNKPPKQLINSPILMAYYPPR